MKVGPARKRKEVALPRCRCLTCGADFEQPWINYTHLDCIKCTRKRGKQLVSYHARQHAPEEYVRETEKKFGPIKPRVAAPTVRAVPVSPRKVKGRS